MHPLAGLRVLGWTLVACVALCASLSFAADRVDYDRQILPILSDNCYKCHGPDEGARKAHLRLDTKEGAFGVKDGKAILVPGKSDKSELIRRISSTDPDVHMPPAASHRKLTAAQIDLIRNWVDQGAKWATHWAFVAPSRPKVPAVSDPWCRNDIDRFVLADLKQAGLAPSKEATRERLIRRVSFDLTGLPPTPKELSDFVNDRSPNAYEKVVDRLLASPRYGERMAVIWLDLARFADTHGYQSDRYRAMWPYRDWVIKAFNSNQPYDQFVTWQLAGDLLPNATKEQRLATAFNRLHMQNEEGGIVEEEFRVAYNVDRVDTFGTAFLGLTFECTRCHDHKFDPIPQADYYKWAGIFRSTEILTGLHPRRGPGRNLSDSTLLVRLDPTPGAPGATKQAIAPDPQQVQELTQELQQAQNQLQRLETVEQRFARGQFRRVNVASSENGDLTRFRRLRNALEDKRAEVAGLQADLDSAKRGVPAGELFAIGVRESAHAGNSPVYAHGEIEDPGPEVARGNISLCNFVRSDPIAPNRSGRFELARWIASPQNPLTTRVIVNRIWGHLFGQGIVRTVDNFGTTGDAPTHPELLDYLATRFVHNGWSIKKTIREIVLSNTYRLGGAYDADDAAIDPGDNLLWRMQPRRLEAEEIRDAILASAGTLDLHRPEGSPVSKFQPGEIRRLGPGQFGINQMTCRSVYLPILRSEMPQVLDVFDVADPDMVTGQREVTTVAPQALFLMNNPLVIGQSRRLAQRITGDPSLNDEARADLAYRLTLCRPATAQERRRAIDYVRSCGPGNEGWASFCQTLFASAEFRYVR